MKIFLNYLDSWPLIIFPLTVLTRASIAWPCLQPAYRSIIDRVVKYFGAYTISVLSSYAFRACCERGRAALPMMCENPVSLDARAVAEEYCSHFWCTGTCACGAGQRGREKRLCGRRGLKYGTFQAS